MKNTERKDLGDHLSIYPKNMFDEAIKEKSQRRERLNLDPGESRVRKGRKWGLFGRHPAKSLPNQQKPEEEERSEEQEPSGDVERTHHAKTWKAKQRHKRDEKSKLGCDWTSRDKMEGEGRLHQRRSKNYPHRRRKRPKRRCCSSRREDCQIHSRDCNIWKQDDYG